MLTEEKELDDFIENSENDGLISIKDGKAHVTNPKTSYGKKAQIIPGNVRVFVDDQEVKSFAYVDSSSKITFILPDHQEQSYKKNIFISNDNMEVFLKISDKKGMRRFILPDYAPTNKLIVNAKEEVIKPFEFTKKEEEEILKELEERGIVKGVEGVYGIDKSKIKEAFTKDDVVVVAKGLPVIPTTDDKVTYHFEPPKLPFDPDSMDRVDYYEMHPIPVVSYGTLLLTKEFGQEGTPGIDVYGKEIPVREPRRREIIPAKDGTINVSSDGSIFTAGIHGIPSFDGKNIRVKPLYEVEGDADVNTTGNIDFPGTVIVYGSTQDKIKIWSKQNIEIKKDVIRSYLDAEESIRIFGRLIDSKIIAGGEAAACMKILPFVEKIGEMMENILKMFEKKLKEVPQLAQADEDKVIIGVIQRFFPDLPDICEELWDMLKLLKRLNPKRVLKIKTVMSNIFNIYKREFNKQEFMNWTETWKEALEEIRTFKGVSYDIYLNYAQLGVIATNGTVYVTGEGCYNTELLVGKDVIINGKPGYFREGSIKAKGNVFIKELGSPNGSKTIVEVLDTSKVVSNIVHPGVVLKMGTSEYNFMEKTYKVEASVKDGKIVLKK